MPAAHNSPGWQFYVDRGGTFTDIVAREPDGTLRRAKLLSESDRYRDATVAGIAEIFNQANVREQERVIECVKIGTTVATNALLERSGTPTALVITRGFRDQLRIGYQNRPKLFETRIVLPEPLYAKVIEAEERLSAAGEVLQPLAEAELEQALSAAFAKGLRSVAITFMHAWRYPQHELRAAEIARRVGFPQISLSHQVSPLIKFVSRGDTTVADAYLSPVVQRYAEQIQTELAATYGECPIYFMKSSGELSSARSFAGKDAILSGPAGGIVAMVQTALDAGFSKLIGLDMGGTSADISHFSGSGLWDCEREFDTTIAGVRLRVPTMAIHTIAAGGGSIVRFDGERFRVGPASAGAMPGPACYRQGGPLCITDCNLLLGRIQPAFFPKVFGPHGNQALDLDQVRDKFTRLAEDVSKATDCSLTPEGVAEGFLRVAVGNMANAIKLVSIQRGHDVSDYTLVSFGGAGGQHACAIATELGISRVLVHPMAGVLSALGMGLSRLGSLRRATCELPLGMESLFAIEQQIEKLTETALNELQSQGLAPESTQRRVELYIKVKGTDSALSVDFSSIPEMQAAFHEQYVQRYQSPAEHGPLIVDSVCVEVLDTLDAPDLNVEGPEAAPSAFEHPVPLYQVPFYSEGLFTQAAVFERRTLRPNATISGPAIIAEDEGTTIVDAGWRATVTPKLDLVLDRTISYPKDNTLPAQEARTQPSAPHTRTSPDPVMLEVFSGLLMSIAEQMGVQLANTAQSINIKERLDFSCAIFDEYGNLVANAPHVPVHLGSMSETVRYVIQANPDLRARDAVIVNDPYHGGTHLPDVTAVMPVFDESGARPLFFVAARGHHADIGGIAPGSMPPQSRTIVEEGVLIDNFKLLDNGVFGETALRDLLSFATYPARNPDQNIADLRAQLAACETGKRELLTALKRYSRETVRAYVRHVQDNAEESVRRAIASLTSGHATCEMDCGASIAVTIHVEHATRSAIIDFAGTSPQLDSNFNTPPAVVHAAVLYVFRTLVQDDIPLNAGCFKPLTIRIPEGSMLSPTYPAATVAGNVETSQSIVDALYAALGGLAASQGTMNNLTLGTASYQYYETIAGGAGAGPGFDGASAVQTHMTNSRMTDPEVFEWRYPVVVEEHSIRAGSGGAGASRGGDGAVRRIRAREPMSAAILAGRRTSQPYGAAGGSPGSSGSTWVERADGRIQTLRFAELVDLEGGDVIGIATPGGGGFGTPLP